MTEQKEKNVAIPIIMIIAVFIGSLGPPLYMKVASKMDMFSTVIQFLFCGGVGILIFQYIKDKESKFIKSINRSSISAGVLLHVLSMAIIYAITYSFYIIVMKKSSVTETVLLIRLSPLFVVFFSVMFLGEKINNWVYAIGSIFLCCSGVVIFLNINLTNLSNVNKWLFFGGIAIAILFAARQIISGYLEKNNILSKESNTAIGMIGGAVILWMSCIVVGHKVVVPVTIYDFCWVVVLGLTVAIPVYLQLIAYGLGDNMTKLALYDYLSPLFTAIMSYVILSEKGFKYELLGIGFALIIAGIYILSKSVDENKPKKTLNQNI